MARHIEDEVKYYYDSHSTEEDLMGETAFHAALANYLVAVLTWLFYGRVYAIYENHNFYLTTDPYENPLVPDVAVIKGVDFQLLSRSYRIGKSGPAPQVVFEIASEETWKKDLEEKPAKYARMGVQEYFAYDPHEPPLPRSTGRRQFGWLLDQNRQVMQEITTGPHGSLWSPHLESWLVPDRTYLRLYDRKGHMRLTQAEADAERARMETKRADEEARRADAEAKRADAEARRADALAEKLRSLGINPDQTDGPSSMK